ncbi:MAG: Ger(x)C family spore germination C-terminal domain-containing protein [Clostridia bacterium]|jgi:hypothetical protein|nr:hypothetical protein [Clostridia bacterium]
MFKKIFKNKIFVCFLIIVIMFFPSAMFTPSEISGRVIITAIGIDATPIDNQIMYEVTVQMLRAGGASGNTSNNLGIVSVTATDITAALDLIQLKVGKKVGFALCKLIILSDSVSNENLVNVLDYFIRSEQLGLNTVLINTDARAKEIIQTSAELDNNSSFSLQRIMDFNMEHINATSTSIGDFFKEYYCYGKASIMAFLQLEDIISESSEQSSGGSGGGAGSESNKGSESGLGGLGGGSGGSGGSNGSGGSGGSGNESSGGQLTDSSDLTKKAIITKGTLSGGVQSSSNMIPAVINEGRSAVFKKGVKAGMLNLEQTRAIKWLKPSGDNRGTLTLKNVNGKDFHSADVTVRVESKNLKLKAYFDGDIPVYKAVVNIDVKVLEILQEDISIDLLSTLRTFVEWPLEDAIRAQIQSETQDIFDYMKTNDVDIIGACRFFSKYQLKKWNKYLEPYKLGENDYEGYLENIRLEVEVNIYSKY